MIFNLLDDHHVLKRSVMKPIRLTLSCFVFMFLVGCVGKGKFTALEERKNKLEDESAEVGKQLQEAEMRISSLDGKVDEQRDEMIKQNALTNQLIAEKIELQRTIDELDKRIGSVTSEAASAQKKLNDQLKNEIESLQSIDQELESLKNVYAENQSKLQTLSAAFYDKATSVGDNRAEVELGKNKLKIIIYHDFLFSSNFQITPSASSFLKEISAYLANYPEFDIEVQGHSDNSQVSATRQFNDGVDLTALRAAAVVRFLNKEAGLNGNQLSAVGRSGFFPRVSNETPAGRALNNRVEIVISPNIIELLKLLE